MKTNTQNQSSELKSRPEQFTTAPAAEQTAEPAALPQIDFKRRRANRALNTQRVVALLRSEAPDFFNLAEVVGQWVWIAFKDKQPREVTASLAEFGFHWNKKRQTWQHPCGQPMQRRQADPRGKYRAYFPADAKPA